MTYQRGQGLNHSLTDAGNLRDTLVAIRAGADRGLTVASFESEMVRRAGDEVRSCTLNTALLHDWEKVKHSPFYSKGMDKNH